LDGGGEGCGVTQVALVQLGVQAVQVAAVAAGADQQAQAVAAGQQGAGDGGADEACRAGDEGGGRGQGGGPVVRMRSIAGWVGLV